MGRDVTRVLAGTVLVFATVAVSSVHARLFRPQEPAPAGDASVVVTAPTPAGDVAVVEIEPSGVVAAGCVECCAPKYCIDYRKHHTWRKVCCGCCEGPYTAMLDIHDPCSRCPVQVAVCVPGCCTDAPQVSCRRGLLGRTITDYTWCCGYRVRIVLDRRNNVTVHTYGA